jgi:hypothetical protein
MFSFLLRMESSLKCVRFVTIGISSLEGDHAAAHLPHRIRRLSKVYVQLHIITDNGSNTSSGSRALGTPVRVCLKVIKMSGRRKGVPRTDEERRMRHGALHPAEKLPSRGTGLRTGSAAGSRGRDRLAQLLVPLLVFACISVMEMILSRRDHERRDS